MLSGVSYKASADFSFLIAIPIMCAASGYELLDSYKYFTSDTIWDFAIGFVISFIVAYVVVILFMKLIQRSDRRTLRSTGLSSQLFSGCLLCVNLQKLGTGKDVTVHHKFLAGSLKATV